MSPFQGSVTITWDGVEFDGPFAADAWEPPTRAGVYAIMMKPDAVAKPNTYQVLYFGESENLSDRGFWRSHHKFGCWMQKAGSTRTLFIGVHAMPNSTLADRAAVERRLIQVYRPDCND